jgi:hypothetical protein
MSCKQCRFRGSKTSKGYPCGAMGIVITDLDGHCEYEEDIPDKDITLDLEEELGGQLESY